MDTTMILTTILKIIAVIIAFFIWVLTLGCIYSKIDQAKTEILQKIDQSNLKEIDILEKMLKSIDLMSKQLDNIDLKIDESISKKSKKKKDKFDNEF